jgi:hypothetical protein
MRKPIEILSKSKNTRNNDERIITDNNHNKHLEFFMNGSWRHSSKCKKNTNTSCNKVS